MRSPADCVNCRLTANTPSSLDMAASVSPLAVSITANLNEVVPQSQQIIFSIILVLNAASLSIPP